MVTLRRAIVLMGGVALYRAFAGAHTSAPRRRSLGSRVIRSETALRSAAHLKRILDASIAEYRALASHPAVDSVLRESGNLYLFRSADQYVFALGSWSGRLRKLLQLDIPVEPGKGYSIMLDRPAACPSLPLLFPEHNVVVTPFVTGLRLGSIMEFAGFNSSVPESRVRQLARSAAQFIEMLSDPTVRQKWMGWRPMTWDSLPVIGRPSRIRNTLIASGHNMLGMTLAPATGRLIADLAMERAPFIDAAPFSPNRFS